jgi:hypothetical protein
MTFPRISLIVGLRNKRRSGQAVLARAWGRHARLALNALSLFGNRPALWNLLVTIGAGRSQPRAFWGSVEALKALDFL